MTSLFKCRRLYAQIPWVNVPNIASRSPWGFLNLIAISHFVHLKYTQWRHDIIHTFKPAKCVHLKVLIHIHMSVLRGRALFTFVFYCDVITHAWRRIAFYDSSDITDRGRMEIDCGFWHWDPWLASPPCTSWAFGPIRVWWCGQPRLLVPSGGQFLQ